MTISVKINLNDETTEKLDTICQTDGTNRSAFTKKALLEAIEQRTRRDAPQVVETRNPCSFQGELVNHILNSGVFPAPDPSECVPANRVRSMPDPSEGRAYRLIEDEPIAHDENLRVTVSFDQPGSELVERAMQLSPMSYAEFIQKALVNEALRTYDEVLSRSVACGRVEAVRR